MNNCSKKTGGAKKSSTRKSTERKVGVVVGKAWPDALEVSLETVDRSQWTKDVVSAGLAIAFVVLLFALTGHAMATKNEAALSEVMGITKLGLICVGVWAGGRAALKALSQWKDHDD